MTLFPNDDVLAQILESWKGYADVLTAEDRIAFDAMMTKCYKYARSIEAKAKPFENEALFMAMLLEQEKIILWLLAKIENLEKGKPA